MMTRIPLALRAGTAIFAVAIATSATAQDAVPPPDVAETPATASEPTATGDIVVTGSRIRRDPLSQDQPIVFVDQEDMAKTGLNSVNDILQRLPSSGVAPASPRQWSRIQSRYLPFHSDHSGGKLPT